MSVARETPSNIDPFEAEVFSIESLQERISKSLGIGEFKILESQLKLEETNLLDNYGLSKHKTWTAIFTDRSQRGRWPKKDLVERANRQKEREAASELLLQIKLLQRSELERDIYSMGMLCRDYNSPESREFGLTFDKSYEHFYALNATCKGLEGEIAKSTPDSRIRVMDVLRLREAKARTESDMNMLGVIQQQQNYLQKLK